METLETLRGKIESTNQLHSIVRTMKTLAAINMTQFEKAMDALRNYTRTIESGFQVVMQSKPEDVSIRKEEFGEYIGVVVMGSDQGMVGQFNERIVNYTMNKLRGWDIRRDRTKVVSIGIRTYYQLIQSGQGVEKHFPIPSSTHGINTLVQRLIVHIQKWWEDEDFRQIVLFYNTPISGTSYSQKIHYLYPIHADWLEHLAMREWDSRSLPIFRMDWQELFSELVRSYLYVSLYRAAAESMTSENSSRLSSMQAAEKNIEERLDGLQGRYHSLRQSSITSELLDVVSGYEALRET